MTSYPQYRHQCRHKDQDVAKKALSEFADLIKNQNVEMTKLITESNEAINTRLSQIIEKLDARPKATTTQTTPFKRPVQVLNSVAPAIVVTELDLLDALLL
jgi:hypothetical protein